MKKISNEMLLTILSELSSYGAMDVEIYYMDQFDDRFSGMTPFETIKKVAPAFNEHEDYFYFNGHGLAVSLSHGELNNRLELLYDKILENVETSLKDEFFREFIGERIAELYDELLRCLNEKN